MEGYIIITPPMIEDLGLKGTELLCFAVIHGYSMDRQGVFTGSISYVSMILGVAPRTAVYALKGLVEKGLVEKTELNVAGISRVEYAVSKEAMQKLHRGVCKNCIGKNATEDSEEALSENNLCKNCIGMGTSPSSSPLTPFSPSPTPPTSLPPISPINTPAPRTLAGAREVGEIRVLEEKKIFGERVRMTEREHGALVEKYGQAGAARLVEILDDYLANHPRKRYVSHYKTILSWCVIKYNSELLLDIRLKNAREAGERYSGMKGGAAALAMAAQMAMKAAAEEPYDEKRALIED